MLLLLFGGGPAGAIQAAAAITIATSVNLTAPVALQAAPAIQISASANLSAQGLQGFAGITFSVTPPTLTAPISLRAAAGITFSAAAAIKPGAIEFAASPAFHISVAADLTASTRETTVDITIDGVNVKDRVRMSGVTIRDVLNDAPNTCSLTIEGDGPAVGQSIRITLSAGVRVLFAGTIQTVDQSYESLPQHLAWNVTAIDDTAKANARRPFGTFVDVSATTIAQTLAATFAPGFATTGIETGLPAVSIVFDGADTFIACLARLATAIGGYCKIEDGGIYLFSSDPGDPPDPIDAAHPFLNSPPIQMNTDASQLRTRVYGKGYGEAIRSDITATETLIPIADGVQFPPLGGDAIIGLTPDGAQSDRIKFTGITLEAGGTLVGPGASPTNAPPLAIAGGLGVTPGPHTVSVVYVTAVGKTLPSPPGSIVAGVFAPPATAPVAAPAQNGTGPDEGSHDYAVSFMTAYGETTIGAISNPVSTSAASGQIAAPGPPAYSVASAGAGADDGYHDYAATFVNANGETNVGPGSAGVSVAPTLVGQIPPPSSVPTLTASAGEGVEAGTRYYRVTFGDANGDTTTGPETGINVGVGPTITPPGGSILAVKAAGGNLTVGSAYWWKVTFGNAAGETEPNFSSNSGSGMATSAGQQNGSLTSIPIGGPGTTKRYIYRNGGSADQFYRLVATINDNTTTSLIEGVADATAQAGRIAPSTNTTGLPYHVVNLTNIPIGPAGTLNRKIWRYDYLSTGLYRFLAEVSGNLTQTYTDTTPTPNLGATAPTSNTTGSMQPNNQITINGIPIGGAGVTARKLYRRYQQSGPYRYVNTINNNTATTYLDTKANSGLGADAPTSNGTGTAVQKVPVSGIPIGGSTVTARKLYRRYGGGTFKLVTTLNNNSTTTYTDGTPNSGLGADALTVPTAIGYQIAVTLSTGGAAVIAREIYMSPTDNQNYRLLAATINDNTTTIAYLVTPDSGLVGQPTPPVADTSGLSQPQGQVNPGAAVLPVASAATFRSGGGWVTLGGGQTVRYTGINAQTLTGIPPTGAGSITTTVLYGSQALPAPMMVGVTGLTVPVLKGSSVHIWIQRDDLQAQAEQRARAGGDGVIEFLITDSRRGVDSLTDRCDADLAMFSRPIVTVAYATRDLKTHSGRTVAINLTSPRISETLTIQDVTITEIDIVPGLSPRYMVKASSVRFSLEDVLRRIIAAPAKLS